MTIPMVFRLLLGTFSEIRDMKRTMAFMGFALFAVLIPSSFGQSLEPKELSEARNAYKAELQKAIKPVNDRYLPKLEGLKNQLTYKGDIRSAVAVDDIITSIQNGQTIQNINDDSIPELREIRNNYAMELNAAEKPITSLYLAKLEVLKQQLALNGNLKPALAVEDEINRYKLTARSDNVPADAVTYNGHWYKVYDEGVKWPRAEGICKEVGAHLAIINDINENNFLANLSDGRPFLWIGASDRPKRRNWVWVNGRPLTFQNWDTPNHQPDNGPIEFYMSMSASGRWHDHNEPDRNGFICEWD